MSYALRKVQQHYQTVDVRSRVEGASPHQLVQLLFDEMMAALQQAELSIKVNNLARKSERLSKALAILHALEASLNFEKGGEIAIGLAQLYQYAREQIIAGNRDNDPARIQAAVGPLNEIAGAWRQIG